MILFIWPTLAQASITQKLDDLLQTLPPGSVHGIEVLGAESGKLIYARNSTLNLLPASTLKTVTSITAYDVLGPDFRFTTQIASQRKPLSGSTYTGDLVLSFSGDPSLTHDDLANLIKALTAQGVRKIKGNLWLDNTVYAGYPRAGGTIWDDRNICFAAPASAIILDRNCFFGWLKPAAKSGKPARMTYDQPDWLLKVDNQVITRQPSETETLGCVQEVWPSRDYEYQLSGCIVPEREPMRMAFSVRNVERSARRFIRSVLSKKGIVLKGQIKTGKPKGAFNYVLVSHQSEALPVLLDRVLEESDNIYTDSLLKTLGAKHTGLPGSYYTGTQAIREIMNEQGVALERSRLVDGSGLSRYNHLSAEDMAEVLAVGWRLWGEDAPWLKTRDKEEQWLKTGYMSGVSNMVGYVFPEKAQEPLIFAVLLNGLRPKQPATKEQVRAFHQDIRQFHRSFLSLLQEK